ncbi:NAD-dependent epimerase/dehydratase family protein [Phytomonospora sp. NPDC050363]|uniref:NAD-dependent epimerase/dehydratase family protein n=1 Tax=Phytomonospora sp. NPDC050363 TaxID=3155642 RepID=UPI0033F8F6E0
MRVLLFGGTGMIGQGALLACLRDERVSEVLAVGRAATGRAHPKLTELIREDLFDLSDAEERLAGYDACLFCLGVSSAGMKEPEYRRVTHDLTLSVAEPLARRNPSMRFLYISGAGTDPDGRSMWSRVKGTTENALLALSFEAYMIRPGIIQPRDGIKSRTRLYRIGYTVMLPVLSGLRAVAPNAVTTTDLLGRVMVDVAADGADKRVLEMADINRLAP